VSSSDLELLKRKYDTADIRGLMAKVVDDATSAASHGGTAHQDDTGYLLTMNAAGKPVYRFTSAGPEELANAVGKGVALVADVSWEKPVEYRTVGGVEIVVLDHHGHPEVPPASEIASYVVRDGAFKNPEFIRRYLRAVALHDVDPKLLTSREEWDLVGQFLTRPLFYNDALVARAKYEEAVAHAFSRITPQDFKKLREPTADAVVRGAAQELSSARLYLHEVVRLAAAAFTSVTALATAAMAAEGFPVPRAEVHPGRLLPSLIDVATYAADRRLAEEAGRRQIALARQTIRAVVEADYAIVTIPNKDGVGIPSPAVVFKVRPPMPELMDYMISQLFKWNYSTSKKTAKPKYVVMPSRDGRMLTVKVPMGVDSSIKSLEIRGGVYIVKPEAVSVKPVAKMGDVLQSVLNTSHRLRI